MPIETVTILITDLVGSTRLATRVGPTRADSLRREHFALLRDAVEETGGTEVKNTGDGLMVAFHSTSAAVECAITMQQRLARRNRSSKEPLHVRIGVAMGDATVEDNDYFGMPSVEAARLCDRAGPDGILVTELVSMMALRSSEVFAPIGPVELKGIPHPIKVFEVRWHRVDAAGGLPLPPQLTTSSTLPFVGRARELATLQAASRAALTGTGRVVMISGEPGSGKTRLLSEAAVHAHREGATVLFGRCQDEFATPYQPLLHAARHFVTVCPPSRLVPLRQHRSILTRLIPELESLLPAPNTPDRPEGRSEQTLVTEAMQTLITSAARHAPILLVLDDLHLARPPLLAVLGQIAEAVESTALAVVVTYRDTEVRTVDPLSDLVVDWCAKSWSDRVALRGLARDEVSELIRQTSTVTSGDDHMLAEDLCRFTNGSPLFVTELLTDTTLSAHGLARILQSSEPWDEAAGTLPTNVAHSVQVRASRLSSAARRVLSVASAIGPQFDARTAGAISSLGEGDCLAALEESLTAGLLRARTGPIDRFEFTSPVMRHGIYADLTMETRVRVHREIARWLEAHDGHRIVEIAEQWFAATTLAASGGQHLSTAIDRAIDAGRRAATDGACRDAGRQYRHAAQLVEASDAGSRRHCELLLQAGEACAAGDQTTDARDAFLRAAEIARRLGDPQLLASAALGYGMGVGDAFYASGADETLVGLLEQALAGLEGDAGPCRVQVLSRLAVELHLTGFVDRRAALSREAVELAASISDARAQLIALYGALRSTWSPWELPGRLAGSDEVIRGAGELGDLDLLYRGHAMKLRVLLEMGDIAAVDVEVAHLERIASASDQPFHEWYVRVCRATRALHSGDAVEADRWMHDAHSIGSHVASALAARIAEDQAAQRHWLAGQPSGLIPLLRSAVQSCPWLAVRRACLAWVLADSGRRTEAFAEFERMAQDDFAAIPQDGNWLLTMGFLAFTCGALGDGARARTLQEALQPHRARLLVCGDATTTWGPVNTALGVLAVTLGSYDAAADCFDDALEQCTSMGAVAQRVFAEREYARMLTVRGRAGDRDRAAGLLRDAAATSAQRGFLRLAEQVAALGATTKLES